MPEFTLADLLLNGKLMWRFSTAAVLKPNPFTIKPRTFGREHTTAAVLFCDSTDRQAVASRLGLSTISPHFPAALSLAAMGLLGTGLDMTLEHQHEKPE